MGQFVPVYAIFGHEVLSSVSVSRVKIGVNYQNAIVVGTGANTQAMILAKDSWFNNNKSLCFSYVEQGFLFKALDKKGLISLEKKHTPRFFRQVLAVFKKPKGFEGTVSYEFEGEGFEKVLSGKSGEFEEIIAVIPQGKYFKVTLKGRNSVSFYFLYDGRDLKKFSRLEKVYRDIVNWSL
jgi:hypothetical protein